MHCVDVSFEVSAVAIEHPSIQRSWKRKKKKNPQKKSERKQEGTWGKETNKSETRAGALSSSSPDSPLSSRITGNGALRHFFVYEKGILFSNSISILLLLSLLSYSHTWSLSRYWSDFFFVIADQLPRSSWHPPTIQTVTALIRYALKTVQDTRNFGLSIRDP